MLMRHIISRVTILGGLFTLLWLGTNAVYAADARRIPTIGRLDDLYNLPEELSAEFRACNLFFKPALDDTQSPPRALIAIEAYCAMDGDGFVPIRVAAQAPNSEQRYPRLFYKPLVFWQPPGREQLTTDLFNYYRQQQPNWSLGKIALMVRFFYRTWVETDTYLRALHEAERSGIAPAERDHFVQEQQLRMQDYQSITTVEELEAKKDKLESGNELPADPDDKREESYHFLASYTDGFIQQRLKNVDQQTFNKRYAEVLQPLAYDPNKNDSSVVGLFSYLMVLIGKKHELGLRAIEEGLRNPRLEELDPQLHSIYRELAQQYLNHEGVFADEEQHALLAAGLLTAHLGTMSILTVLSLGAVAASKPITIAGTTISGVAVGATTLTSGYLLAEFLTKSGAPQYVADKTVQAVDAYLPNSPWSHYLVSNVINTGVVALPAALISPTRGVQTLGSRLILPLAFGELNSLRVFIMTNCSFNSMEAISGQAMSTMDRARGYTQSAAASATYIVATLGAAKVGGMNVGVGATLQDGLQSFDEMNANYAATGSTAGYAWAWPAFALDSLDEPIGTALSMSSSYNGMRAKVLQGLMRLSGLPEGTINAHLQHFGESELTQQICQNNAVALQENKNGAVILTPDFIGLKEQFGFKPEDAYPVDGDEKEAAVMPLPVPMQQVGGPPVMPVPFTTEHPQGGLGVNAMANGAQKKSGNNSGSMTWREQAELARAMYLGRQAGYKRRLELLQERPANNPLVIRNEMRISEDSDSKNAQEVVPASKSTLGGFIKSTFLYAKNHWSATHFTSGLSDRELFASIGASTDTVLQYLGYRFEHLRNYPRVQLAMVELAEPRFNAEQREAVVRIARSDLPTLYLFQRLTEMFPRNLKIRAAMIELTSGSDPTVYLELGGFRQHGSRSAETLLSGRIESIHGRLREAWSSDVADKIIAAEKAAITTTIPQWYADLLHEMGGEPVEEVVVDTSQQDAPSASMSEQFTKRLQNLYEWRRFMINIDNGRLEVVNFAKLRGGLAESYSAAATLETIDDLITFIDEQIGVSEAQVERDMGSAAAQKLQATVRQNIQSHPSNLLADQLVECVRVAPRNEPATIIDEQAERAAREQRAARRERLRQDRQAQRAAESAQARLAQEEMIRARETARQSRLDRLASRLQDETPQELHQAMAGAIDILRQDSSQRLDGNDLQTLQKAYQRITDRDANGWVDVELVSQIENRLIYEMGEAPFYLFRKQTYRAQAMAKEQALHEERQAKRRADEEQRQRQIDAVRARQPGSLWSEEYRYLRRLTRDEAVNKLKEDDGIGPEAALEALRFQLAATQTLPQESEPYMPATPEDEAQIASKLVALQRYRFYGVEIDINRQSYASEKHPRPYADFMIVDELQGRGQRRQRPCAHVSTNIDDLMHDLDHPGGYEYGVSAAIEELHGHFRKANQRIASTLFVYHQPIRRPDSRPTGTNERRGIIDVRLVAHNLPEAQLPVFYQRVRNMIEQMDDATDLYAVDAIVVYVNRRNEMTHEPEQIGFLALYRDPATGKWLLEHPYLGYLTSVENVSRTFGPR